MKQIIFFVLLAITIIGAKGQDTIYYDAKGAQVEMPDSAGFKSVTVADSADSSLYICRIYWMSGQIRKELRYKVENNDAVYVGRYAEWHPNGALKLEVNYVNGKKEGEEKTYDEKNKLLGIEIHSNGIFVKALDANGNDAIYVVVEQMPQYPGGEKALMRFINSNLRYPTSAYDAGRTRVIVRFEVSETGDVKQVHVIGGIRNEFDEEAILVVRLMPKWIPGTQGGKPVAVWYTLPITFTLNK